VLIILWIELWKMLIITLFYNGKYIVFIVIIKYFLKIIKVNCLSSIWLKVSTINTRKFLLWNILSITKHEEY